MPSTIPINVHDLPPYEGSFLGGPFVGFVFNEQGVRCKMSYGCLDEKLYCECSTLCDQKLWREAKEKLDERVDCTGKICDSDYRKIQIAFLNEPNSTKRDFDEAIAAINQSLYSGDGCIDEITDQLHEVLKHRVIKLVGSKQEDGFYPNYDNAGVDALEQAVALWFVYPETLMRIANCGDMDYGDDAHDNITVILNVLLRHGAIRMVRKMAMRGYKLSTDPQDYFGAIFLRYHAECSEAMGDSKAAHDSYKLLSSAKEEPYCDDDDDNGNGGFTKDSAGLVLLCPKGSLAERMERTSSTQSA